MNQPPPIPPRPKSIHVIQHNTIEHKSNYGKHLFQQAIAHEQSTNNALNKTISKPDPFSALRLTKGNSVKGNKSVTTKHLYPTIPSPLSNSKTRYNTAQRCNEGEMVYKICTPYNKISGESFTFKVVQSNGDFKWYNCNLPPHHNSGDTLKVLLSKNSSVATILCSMNDSQQQLSSTQQQVVQHKTSGVEYLKNRSSTVGMLVTIHAHERIRSYAYYKIRLKYVAEVFGNTYISWNQSHKAARQIYGNSSSSQVIRYAIEKEHQALYRKGAIRTKSGTLYSAQDLFRLFEMGLKDGSPRMFTYVLQDKHFCCSETGVKLSKDFMSKHAVHAKAKPTVRYAGEFFFFWNAENPQPCLVVDNNSGTFAPDQKYLQLVEKVFQLNFPGIYMQVLDRDSETLKLLKSKMFGT